MLMRKIYLTLFGAMMMMAASAQTVVNGFRQDSIIAKSDIGDLTSKTVYEYNAKGQCTVSYSYSYQGSASVEIIKTVNTFDDQGRKTKSEDFTYANGEYTLTAYTEFSEFNSDGLHTVEILYQQDEQNPGAGIQAYTKTVIDKYNGKNPEHTLIYQNMAGSWLQFQEMTYEYNSAGVPTKITLATSILGMSMTVVTELEYDSHNMPTKSTQTNSLMPSENVVTTYVNTYDDNGLPTMVMTVVSGMGMGMTMVSYYYWSTTSGIAPIIGSKQDNGKFFDLNGRRVDNPARGLYIHNGRKVVIK